MKREQAGKWLKVGAGFVFISGVLVAGSALPALSGLLAIFLDILIWPFDGNQSLAAAETRLLAAIGGGIMVGWGVTLWMLAGRGLIEAPHLSRRIILVSTLSWFVVDSIASIAAGAWLNAVANLSYLLLFMIPLMRWDPDDA